jgi:hypothetical protein
VLTEPVGGTITKDGEREIYSEYVSAAHVKFLRQAGLRVIPISYKSTQQELDDMLSQVNAVYI